MTQNTVYGRAGHPGGPKIIALAGRAGSGKSTAAAHLVATKGAHVFSFAKPLKELARRLLPFTEAQVFGTQAEKEAPAFYFGDSTGADAGTFRALSARDFMQRLGQGAREILGDDVWTRACLAAIRRDWDCALEDRNLNIGAVLHQIYVIDDLRYPNEAATVVREGGWVVKLVCPDAPPSSNPDHPSERGVDEIDDAHIHATIVSKKTPGSEDLKARIDAALADLGVFA